MGELSEKLIDNLELNKTKPSYKRNNNFKIYPFFTRNPERAKFSNGFTPVTGVLSRNSLGLKLNYNIEDYNIEKIVENVEINEMDDENKKSKFLKSLFDYSHLDSFKHPFLLNYKTLSNGEERKGEIEIGKFVNKFFDLSNNKKWIEFIGDKTSKNLVEEILLESINEIDKEEKKNIYKLINEGLYEERTNDLDFLLSHKDFALKYLDLFFAFYYFQYIMQTTLFLDRLNVDNRAQLYKTFFTLESEKLTSTRETNKSGFNLIKEIRDYTLVNEILLGYINHLIEDEEIYSFEDIKEMSSFKKEIINNELKLVLEKYTEVKEKNDWIRESLEENILLFKTWLREDITKETKSRYYLSIEEIGDLYFLKRRGKLGKVLTLKKDMLILLTAIVVKDEKMIIKELFHQFEKRGVFLDRYSKEEILRLYEKMNILDKKSDSGEAKYVKPIL